ncbi:hypothetical protein [Macrococcus carouselicus]|uniref:Uncharacterized protein n=1 Tax=Macrococcus carouselicus TaxID=69969 RepID=A0A9Q8CKX7_9STAP|nr:hypothetical protein [Macrococcus carouselicus]TDM04076.1 hypothetical protein ERX40_02595 [Macrococcus carouselicus]
METINTRLDRNEEDIKRLERSIQQLDTKIENTEKDIMKEVKENQRDIKVLLKESEDNNKAKSEKLFDGLNKLTESQYQQTLMQKDIQNEVKTAVKDFAELSKDYKESDKKKTAAIWSFAISLVLMILGTFWRMATIGVILPIFFI